MESSRFSTKECAREGNLTSVSFTGNHFQKSVKEDDVKSESQSARFMTNWCPSQKGGL